MILIVPQSGTEQLLLERARELGVDIVVHSTTKYLNGHSDVVGGCVVTRHKDHAERISYIVNALGLACSPFDAWLVLRGIKTLGPRMAAHERGALAVAQFLERHPKVERVYYPGLASHPDHAIAARQMTGFGGMVCIDVQGGQAGAYHVFDRLKVIKRAASLGGVESLCSLPVLTSQYGLTDDELVKAGVTRGMMRLSIGLEDPEDLIADLRQALG